MLGCAAGIELRFNQVPAWENMGYDVHITRKGNWFGESGPEIALAYVPCQAP